MVARALVFAFSRLRTVTDLMDLPGDNTGFNRVTNAIGEVTNHLADAGAARAA